MSELTECCHCVLREIRERAAKRGKVVEVRPSSDSYFVKAVDVFVRSPDEELDEEEHFAAWLGEVTESCCC